MQEKQRLRNDMRKLRRAHIASLPDSLARLMFLRPPAAIAGLVPAGGCVGLYHATGAEAPTAAYARWFFENGRSLALPWFADRSAPMLFRVWHNPWIDDELEIGPFGILQPRPDSPEADPDLAFVPLLAFTARAERLGQGGGHYDRWLAANPHTPAIGLAWDCQLVDALPLESHDCKLHAVVTPTRLFKADR